MAGNTRGVVWHGTTDAATDLLRAVEHNCACVKEGGIATSICASHDMLARDQRAIDGLLFARSILRRLRTEEFGPRSRRLAAAGR